MKKITAIFLSILVGLFIILSFIDRRGDYVAEKMMFRANYRLNQAIKKLESTPHKVFEKIAGNYKTIIREFPDSPLRAGAQLQLGSVFIAQKDFEGARKAYQEIFVDYPHSDVFKSRAALAIGKTYELENNAMKAIETYEKIIQDYPNTEVGLSVPLYIGNYYRSKGYPEQAREAYARAEQHYLQLAANKPDTVLEVKSLQFLVNLYLAQEKWTKAIETMGQVLLKYPNAPIIGTLVQSINTLSIARLKDTALAERIYTEFMEKNPQHQANKGLQQILDGFTALKDKGVPAENERE